jgi:integral membrane protein
MNKQIKAFLIVGKLEGYSYLLLLGIAMPLKYVFEIPEAVRIIGMLHGLLFVAFMFLILNLIQSKLLSFKNGVIAFLLSLIPFGTFYLGRFFKDS